ncbi:MAG: nucleoside-diphosphate sugar epimerase/dehydratase [Thermodesulfobacteriota bacterium]|nr:nucleoside-diphosphate sugar epimerase/dehydratase [Thermodesulfobacteriota bacterium]
MKFKQFYKNFLIILLVDMLLLAASLIGAHLIRFEFSIPVNFMKSLIRILPWALLVKLICFYMFNLYRGMWRYTSISDLFNVIKASTVSTLLVVFFVLFKSGFIGYSRSVFLIDWCLTVFFIAGFRLGVRMFYEQFSKDQPSPSDFLTAFRVFAHRKKDSKNLIIIGAGNCGEKIFREIHNNKELQYNVVGFLDDSKNKIGRTIHGIPVLGRIDDIIVLTKKVKANEALIAIPSARGRQMRRIVELCKSSAIPFKTVPGYGELINGRVTVNAIREVAYRDLLGREMVKLDEKQIGAYLAGQNVLVTGAGGSIGSELCRQICRFKPGSILLFERAESPLYEIELELKKNFADIKVVPILADIQHKLQIEKVFHQYEPQTVFHAAAYKHVPMLELQPWKALENNIQGTANLLEIVTKFNIERFVFVSTDKAVRPTNVMGASKRVAEMLVSAQNSCGHSKTRFIIVRFGNVVGSVGSVVPLFKKQIENGGPVTVTHPEVTRYFMTIPEACQLILQAGAMGSGGEIYLLDMGTTIKISDMARDLIRLSGFEPDVDIKIEYIGLRPGEKLYEELITEGENVVPTGHEKIMVLKGMECNLQTLNGQIEDLTALAPKQDEGRIKTKLKEIVPEYSPAH